MRFFSSWEYRRPALKSMMVPMKLSDLWAEIMDIAEGKLVRTPIAEWSIPEIEQLIMLLNICTHVVAHHDNGYQGDVVMILEALCDHVSKSGDVELQNLLSAEYIFLNRHGHSIEPIQLDPTEKSVMLLGLEGWYRVQDTDEAMRLQRELQQKYPDVRSTHIRSTIPAIIY
jgi:hypothetical protein